jgi:hypothetical protein
MCEGWWGTTGKSTVCSNLPHWVIRGLFQNYPIVHHLQLVVFAKVDKEVTQLDMLWKVKI